MSDTWIEVTIETTTEAVEAITNILYEHGAQGAMIDDPKDFSSKRPMNMIGTMQKKNCSRGLMEMILSG